jgi:hypothetical protein
VAFYTQWGSSQLPRNEKRIFPDLGTIKKLVDDKSKQKLAGGRTSNIHH